MKVEEAIRIISINMDSEFPEWNIFLRSSIKKYFDIISSNQINYALKIMTNRQLCQWLIHLITDKEVVYNERDLVIFDKGYKRFSYDI